MNRSDQFPEVKEIADAVCAETVTQEQIDRLEQILKGNFAAKEFYYDCLNLHIQLKQPANSSMELVYRRLTQTTAEEFVMRPKGGDNGDINEPPLTSELSPPSNNRKLFAIIAALLIAFVACLIWLFVSLKVPASVAKLVEGQLNIIGNQGMIENNALFPGVYLSNSPTTIKLIDGDTIHLKPKSRIKLYNNHEVKAVYGRFKFESLPGQNTIIHNNGFIANTNGSELSLNLGPTPRITTGTNTFFNPYFGRPVHYWSFEGQQGRIVDSAGKAFGVKSAGISHVKGQVGNAVHFDTSRQAHINLGSGGATALGTGTFAVTEGITIEALIRPEFVSELLSRSEVFSQVDGDNKVRISLGFQSANDLVSLHFGLHILGHGFQELIVPLDGKTGRPTLAQLQDGNFHHLAATYHAQTGLKTVYINGEKLNSAQYQRDSKVLSGGAGSAIIGGRSGPQRSHLHGFSGAIDEVAFYNFAIPEYTLTLHLENVRRGKNYFGFQASEKKLPDRIRLALPANRTIILDKKTKLPSKLLSD